MFYCTFSRVGLKRLLMAFSLPLLLSGIQLGCVGSSVRLSDELRALRDLRAYAVVDGRYPESLSAVHEDYRDLPRLAYESAWHSFCLFFSPDGVLPEGAYLDILVELQKEEGRPAVFDYIRSEFQDFKGTGAWIAFELDSEEVNPVNATRVRL